MYQIHGFFSINEEWINYNEQRISDRGVFDVGWSCLTKSIYEIMQMIVVTIMQMSIVGDDNKNTNGYIFKLWTLSVIW